LCGHGAQQCCAPTRKTQEKIRTLKDAPSRLTAGGCGTGIARDGLMAREVWLADRLRRRFLKKKEGSLSVGRSG